MRIAPFRLLFFLGSLGLITLYSACNSGSAGMASDDPNTPPDENRFTVSVITQPGELDEPMAFTFPTKDRILLVERKGGVKSVDLNTNEVKSIFNVPVNTKYTNKEGVSREAEEGLMGIIADPNFEQNHWIYMYYADPDEIKHVLARWELNGDEIDPASKKVMLEVPTQREVCCHTGGGMAFDAQGNLYLTTGNNTANPPSGLSNLDERPGEKNSDDQRTAGNTNDLRGKILRIHPQPDASYTIPEGNLFPEGTEKTRPEIYTMGHRNP
ncbi:MAG: PQQ-dependent sugar dehydrogenase, partial [Lewinella sp.]|nr:PQQ-dependent sugar dehydrogenase [Lewinella sp.]